MTSRTGARNDLLDEVFLGFGLLRLGKHSTRASAFDRIDAVTRALDGEADNLCVGVVTDRHPHSNFGTKAVDTNIDRKLSGMSTHPVHAARAPHSPE